MHCQVQKFALQRRNSSGQRHGLYLPKLTGGALQGRGGVEDVLGWRCRCVRVADPRVVLILFHIPVTDCSKIFKIESLKSRLCCYFPTAGEETEAQRSEDSRPAHRQCGSEPALCEGRCV